MNDIKSALAEPIKTTTLGRLVIVTTRTDNPYSLRPFQIVAWDSVTGKTLSMADCATLAAALLAHDQLIRNHSEQKKGAAKTAPSG